MPVVVEELRRDGSDRYAIYVGGEVIAETSREAIGMALEILWDEGQIGNGVEVGIMDRLGQRWLVEPGEKVVLKMGPSSKMASELVIDDAIFLPSSMRGRVTELSALENGKIMVTTEHALEGDSRVVETRFTVRPEQWMRVYARA